LGKNRSSCIEALNSRKTEREALAAFAIGNCERQVLIRGYVPNGGNFSVASANS
jgi:hypothetical protein